MHCLPFFTSSLPDETFQSRVARYHLLSGNRTEIDTFHELFDNIPFTLEQIVPAHMMQLALRMPGDPEDTLQTMVLDNTLLPAFMPFIGKPAETHGSAQIVSAAAVINHLPRRVVGKHGDARLCLHCVVEDSASHGVPFWHRSHQIPGVQVCWKHSVKLAAGCPECHLPFQRHNRLLQAPWLPCRCGWHAEGHPSAPNHGDERSRRLALFAHDLLEAKHPPIDPSVLAGTYRQRILERGFTHGKKASTSQYESYLIDEYGDEFLAQLDQAYAAKRMTFWIRIVSNAIGLDMPITRHLLLCMDLFGSFQSFQASVQQQLDSTSIQSRRTSVRSATSEAGPTDLRFMHRQRILEMRRRTPTISLEQLWHKTYRTVAWLYDNDRAWLNKTLSSPPKTDQSGQRRKPVTQHERDEEFSRFVDKTSAELLEQAGKPVRITRERLLATLPLRVVNTPSHRERFPLTLMRVDTHIESTWYFRTRRILWACAALAGRGDTVSGAEVSILSGVGYQGVIAIVEYFLWSLEDLGFGAENIPARIAKAGIDRHWEGPPAWIKKAIGGKNYKAEKAWRVNASIGSHRSLAIINMVGLPRRSRHRESRAMHRTGCLRLCCVGELTISI